MAKPVRLASTATALQVDLRLPDEYYDHDLGYSVAPTAGGRPRPIVEAAAAASTMSKTNAAPGDDDDDRDRERCY